MSEEHERRAEDLEREANRMEGRAEEVDEDIKDLREDWSSKESSQQVPGAVSPDAAAPGGLGEDDEDEDGSDDS